MSKQPGPTTPTWIEEDRLIAQGYRLVAGVDEVGRGPLAGPVVAAAVVLDPAAALPWYDDLNDSKLLSPGRRKRLAPLIRHGAVAVGIGAVESDEIDAIGIVPATRAAMTRAVANLPVRPDHLLIDAVPLSEPGLPYRHLIKGDSLCRSIAAASIVAKVARDGRMVKEHAAYPDYGFDRHKGYASQEHLERLARLGPCPIHRRSFAPVRAMLAPVPNDQPTARISRGHDGEEAAAAYLESNGYRIVERNFNCPWGEIDIVARQADTLAFIEVKARRHDRLGTGFESITRRKQRRLVLAAQEYLRQHGLQDSPWRIDAISVRINGQGDAGSLEHLENAVMGF